MTAEERSATTSAANRSAFAGAAIVSAIGAAAAALLVVPSVFLWMGIIATAGALGWVPADPTWNDGDVGIAWMFGGVPSLIVLVVAAASVAAVARRFGLRVRAAWLTTIALALACALGLAGVLAERGFS